MSKRYVRYMGLWMTPEMRDDIIELTDVYVADTLREALRLGLKKMKRRRR